MAGQGRLMSSIRGLRIRGRHKPGSVSVGGLGPHSAAAIHLGDLLPSRSSSQPGSPRGETPLLIKSARDPYLALLRVGFAMRTLLPDAPVRFYRTLSPLPVSFRLHRRYTLCGTFPWRRCEHHNPAGVTRHPCFVEPGLSSLSQRTHAAASAP